MSEFTEIAIPSLGMDTDTVPRLLDKRKAPLIKNFLMDRSGVLPMRGPLCEGTAWNAGVGIAPVAQWVFDDKVLVSRYLTAAVPGALSAAASATPGALVSGQAYYYKLTALLAAGESVASDELGPIRVGPPSGVVATVGPTQIGKGMPAGTYWYKITAVNASGQTLASAEVSVTTPGSNTGPSLSWSPVVGATSYRVYESTTGSGAENAFFTVASSGLDPQSAGRNSFTAMTAGTPPVSNTFGQNSAALSWAAVAGATGYRIYRGTASGAESVFFAPGAVTSFTDTGAAGTAGTPPPSGAGAGTPTRDVWVAPYRKAPAAGGLRALQLTSKLVDLINNSASDLVAANADGVPGRKSVRAGGFVYGHSGDATTTVTQLGGVYKKTKLLKWDGTATPVPYVHGPQASQDITSHYNRLIVLGGIAEGGSAIQFNSLYWSDPFAADGTALPDTAAAWQDDVSGLVNQLVVGSDDTSDVGVALAHVGPNLCILKRRSLWMMYGTSPSNWTIKQISNEIGCIDPRSVVEYDQGVYFMSDRGFMYYDGSRLDNVSAGLSSTLVTSARKQCGATGSDGGYVRASKIGPGYLLVTTGEVVSDTLATVPDTDAWLLYAPGGVWSQLSSAALPVIAGGAISVNYPYLVGDQSIVRASYLFSPSNAPANTRGRDSVDGNANLFVIPSRWVTRTPGLATPPTESRLQRVIADYFWSLANGGWQITIVCRGPQGVVSPTAVLGAPVSIAANLPARGGIDVLNETDEVYLDIQALASAPAAFNDAEFHRVVLESRPTHRAKATL